MRSETLCHSHCEVEFIYMCVNFRVKIKVELVKNAHLNLLNGNEEDTFVYHLLKSFY